MTYMKAVAVVGVGAVMPEADDARKFWENIKAKRYSIKDVPGERWNASLYYAADPTVEDKTYSKIGSWVQDFNFDPIKWGILMPASVLKNMDDSQKWAIAASRQALLDYGYPERPLDSERVAVIFGNSLAGEKHYRTNLRIHIPQFTTALANLAEFQRLSPEVRESLLNGMEQTIKAQTPDINEDTMPGELANILAGRVANVFNFAGANFVTDAACASSLAAFQAAVDGLMSYQYDAVLAGGVDRNNGAASFVKFSKIGALSPDGSRPYAEGANGFVMGEGAAVFLLKRLEDAERDQDNVYAVIRGIGSSSDGKGKGITAPNPIGQQRAIRRAWQDAGVSLASAGLIEGHGTSTKVGDVVEVNSLAAVFGEAGLPTGSIGLGSVKSNIGHLKSASGAAGLLKVIFALKEQTLPPSANFHAPNPDIKFSETPFYVVDEAQPWEKPTGEVRRAGISSFGFGGTNFHMVVEEHVPGLLTSRSNSVAVPAMQTTEQAQETGVLMAAAEEDGPLYSGMAFAAGENVAALREQLAGIRSDLDKGILPPNRLPAKQELSQQHRMAVSYEDAQQLSDRLERAEKALDSMPETVWQAYSAHGIYYGEGAPGKIAFLFPGQGSQYVNMMRDIHDRESIVAETFREADDVMTPHLGQPLSAYIFEDREDEASQKAAEDKLKDTTITQPAILTANIAMLRLMEKFYIKPDMLIGHSLGEYAALVTAEAITFREGLETVSARGQAMSAIDVEDNGAMAAVSAPIAKVEEVLSQLDGYAVLANVNSPVQSVIGGDTDAIDQAVAAFEAEGIRAVKIPVSHAFHTRIVAPASAVLRKMLDTVKIQAPKMPIAANVTGKLYPTDPDEIRDMLGDHIASPVQFVSGVQTLYEQGCRVFIEAGPKRVLSSLSRDILKDQKGIAIVSTNHPRKGGTASFHEALCGLYAAGVGGEFEALAPSGSAPEIEAETPIVRQDAPRQAEGGPYPPLTGSVVVSGAGLGLPGREHAVFEDDNIQRILKGDSRIEALPEEVRQEMIYRRVTRLEKGENGAEWVPIDSIGQTTKLAGQRGRFDLADEFGMKPERADVLDISTKLAIAAGIEALRDAGIPLVMGYKQTSTGSYLPQRWMLPKSMADETGVIFGSAFPGLDELSKEAGLYHHHQSLQGQIKLLREVLAETPAEHQPRLKERIQVLQAEMAALNYGFDRKFIFRVLNMGHSQFAEYIGARGPNSAVNAACATTTHAIALAEDWIRAGRCRRVVVVAGDDVTGGDLVNWIGTGLLATGAATTEGDLRKAALPFDLRRNGMIMGMGAAALVVEAQDAVSERGMRGIAEVLATDIANSAFHGTRLDVEHVSEVMDRLMTKAEAQFGVERHAIAARTMFMSHETYTPARGGSAAAEIRALRHTFGEQADQVMITNTKGYTGHTMGVGVEDVVAIKGLEYSLVPPIANLDGDFQPDPDLGNLNLTREAGQKDVDYALRLGAGFGSQIAMALFRRIPGVGERVEDQTGYRDWLAALAGHPSAETEIVHRTLRIMDQGKPIVPAKGSSWRYGTPPNGWADRPEDNREAMPELAAAPVAVQTAAPVQNVDAEEVKDFVLGLVSEKTGYPIEILDLGLDLEADLGVDTVKQAELFAAVRENYGIARQEDLRLVDYNTLEKVIGFVLEMAGGGEPAAEAVAVAEPAAVPEELSGSGSVPRRVPVPMLRPKLALCLPTGLGLDDADRVLVVEEVEGTGVMLGEKLAERGAEVLRITEMDSLVEQARRWAEERPVSGVYYLSGMSPEPLLDEITIEGWRGLLESRLEPLFELMKMLPEDVFLLTAIQSDGLQGYSSSGGVSTGAGIAGFSKALAMERPGSVIKTLDFGSGMDAAEMADRLLAETLHDPDAVEIGYHLGQRFSITLVEQPWTEIPQFDLGVEPVFLVSGGTGGITLPIVEDLAMRTHGKFFLIGRSPLPAADDPDLALLRKSREDLQSKWMQASLSGEEKLTPVQIRGKLDAFERLAATREAMNAIRAAGGKTEYLRGDVSDPASMEAVVSQVKRDAGRIDVLIHAAGYERSRKLRRKPLEEFRQIIDVKATGFVNLYKAMQQTGGLPRAMVLFSSIAGRYGNTGQVDYSAANDLLARFASGLKSKHPAMRVITLDWGAWAEVGMASRGNIPWLMSQAGIEMIDPAEGAPIVYRELVYGQGHEALFAGSLGALAETASKEGGLDLEAANAALREGNPPHVMLSSVSGYSPTEGMTLEVTLNPEDEPFLHDHSLNGTPLLPGVMGIEGFAVAAQHIASVMGQAGDSYRVAGLADIRFLTPFKFYRNEPRHILWKALPLWREDHLSVAVTLESISPSRLKTENEELVRHFSGVVGLQPTDQPIPASSAAPPDWNGHYTLPDDLIYQLYFHGPAFQVLEGVQRSGSQLLGKLKPNLPEFTSRPITLDTTPVLLELCLQTAGIWEIGLTGALSLPHSIGSVRLYHREVNGLPVFAEVSKREDAGGLVFNSRVVDAKGQVYLEMENYRTVVTPYPVEVSQREPLQRLVNGD